MVRTLSVVGGVVVLVVSLACGGSSSSGEYEFLTDIPTGGGAASADCPAAAVTASSWSDGTRVTLIALHPDDAYADGEWLSQLPISGRATGEMTLTDGCWMGGPFEADNGDSFYFYKGAFTQP